MATQTSQTRTDSLIAWYRARLEALGAQVVVVAPASAKVAPTKKAKVAPAKNGFVGFLVEKHQRAEAQGRTSEDNKALAARIRAKGFSSKSAALKAVAGRTESWATMVERAYA